MKGNYLKSQMTLNQYLSETCQQRVFRCIKANEPVSRQEVARLTGLSINNVCGRVYELIDMGDVEAYRLEGERREVLEVCK